MMRRLLLLALLPLLGACGGVKNLDPLGGLGGTADNARYGFESGAQGWTHSLDVGTCIGVQHVTGQSLYGQSSLAMRVLNMGNHYGSSPTCPGSDDAARVSVDFTGNTPTMTGKELSAWVYAPAGISYSDSAPTGAQLFAIDTAGVYGGASANLLPGQWVRVSFKPVATSTLINSGGVYINHGYDPGSIQRIGIKLSPAGTAPCDFTFTGIVLIDSVHW
jgi:hypothetical protein